MQQIIVPYGGNVIGTDDYLITLPESWEGNFYISQTDDCLRVYFYPSAAQPREIFEVHRVGSLEEKKKITAAIDSKKELGWVPGALLYQRNAGECFSGRIRAGRAGDDPPDDGGLPEKHKQIFLNFSERCGMEGNILLWIQENLRSAALTPVMEFITHLGDTAFIWIAMAAVFFVFKTDENDGTAGAGGASGFSADQQSDPEKFRRPGEAL